MYNVSEKPEWDEILLLSATHNNVYRRSVRICSSSGSSQQSIPTISENSLIFRQLTTKYTYGQWEVTHLQATHNKVYRRSVRIRSSSGNSQQCIPTVREHSLILRQLTTKYTDDQWEFAHLQATHNKVYRRSVRIRSTSGNSQQSIFTIPTVSENSLIFSCSSNVRWATTWQNQQNECAPSEDSDQPGHPPSLIRVFAVRMKKAWVLSYPLSTSEDSDQTGRMPRLIWVFVGRTVIWLVCHEAAQFSDAVCSFLDVQLYCPIIEGYTTAMSSHAIIRGIHLQDIVYN